MKTVLIYDQVCVKPLSFRVVDGDYRHLDNVYINSADATDEQIDEVLALTCYPKDHKKYGYQLADFTSYFPIDAVKDGAHVVIVGFLP